MARVAEPGIWRNRSFCVFFGSQLLSNLGDSALWLAAGVWVKELTGSSAAAGLTFFFFAAPSLVAPLAGWLADILPRRQLIQATEIVAAVAVLMLFYVDDAADVWLVYTVMTLYGLFTSVLSAAQSGFIVEIVRRDQLPAANSALRTVREGLRIGGPAAGAAIYAAFGGQVVAAIDAGTFVLAALGLMLIGPTNRVRREPSGEAWISTVFAGFRHLRNTRTLARVTLVSAAAMGVLGLLEPILFEVVDKGLARDSAFLGVLISAQGIGAVLAGPLAPFSIRRLGAGRLIAISFGIFVAALMALAGDSLPVVAIGAILLGSAATLFIIGGTTLIQWMTPDALQGRAYSAFELGLVVPQAISIAVGAWLVTRVDYRWLLIASAIAMAVCAGAMARSRGAHTSESEGEPHADTSQQS